MNFHASSEDVLSWVSSGSVSRRILASSRKVQEDVQTAEQHGEVNVNDGRVLILGNAGVGKTSLKRHLMDKTFLKEPVPTEGVDANLFVEVTNTRVDQDWKETECDEESQHRRYAVSATVETPVTSNPALKRSASFFASYLHIFISLIIIVGSTGHICLGIASLQILIITSMATLTFFKEIYTHDSDICLDVQHAIRYGQSYAVNVFFFSAVYQLLINYRHGENEKEGFVCWIVLAFVFAGILSGILIGFGSRNGFALGLSVCFLPNQIYIADMIQRPYVIFEFYDTKMFNNVLRMFIGYSVCTYCPQHRSLLRYTIFPKIS